MLRWAVTALFLLGFCLCTGCGGDSDKSNNPSGLDYSKEGPPKRGAAPAPKTGGKKKDN